METVRARHTGPCFGVRDALAATQAAIEAATGPVSALGAVVHNPQAMGRLEDSGLAVDPESAARLPAGGQVVVTAHGAAPRVFEQAAARGLTVLDTTCPLVRRVQDAARGVTAAGRTLVVVGHADHPEVRGVVGWAGGGHVVDGVAGARAVPSGLDLGVVVQSTFPASHLAPVLDALRARARSLEVHDTRCPVVTLRQRSAVELAEKADVIVVVGGRGSANTRALAETCAERRPTHHVETAAELRPEWFAGGQRIGITSGTSTPDWLVDEVDAAVRAYG